MKIVKIKELKKGDFFTLKPYGDYPTELQVYVKDEYCRSAKKYFGYKYGDVNFSRLFSGEKEVYTDFIF